jgi:hypothetical protein
MQHCLKQARRQRFTLLLQVNYNFDSASETPWVCDFDSSDDILKFNLIATLSLPL